MHQITVPDDWRYAAIRRDIEAGRLWKARDRLQGHLSELPADQVVLSMLGSVWYAMGDLPQAGRHWWLTERDDGHAVAARAAFEERFGRNARNVLRALPRPAKPEQYPESVRERLESLAMAADADTIGWRPSDGEPVDDESVDWDLEWSRSRRHRFAEIIAGLVVGVLTVIGAAVVVVWIYGILT